MSRSAARVEPLRSGAARIILPRMTELDPEAQALLASLRKHGQVLETDDEDAPLTGDQTHVLLTTRTGRKLIEKRKSYL